MGTTECNRQLRSNRIAAWHSARALECRLLPGPVSGTKDGDWPARPARDRRATGEVCNRVVGV